MMDGCRLRMIPSRVYPDTEARHFTAGLGWTADDALQDWYGLSRAQQETRETELHVAREQRSPMERLMSPVANSGDSVQPLMINLQNVELTRALPKAAPVGRTALPQLRLSEAPLELSSLTLQCCFDEALLPDLFERNFAETILMKKAQEPASVPDGGNSPAAEPFVRPWSWPSALGFVQYAQLRTVDLCGNELSGELTFKLLPENLTSLDLSFNKLAGRLPLEELLTENKTMLSKLVLTGNMFSGIVDLSGFPSNYPSLKLVLRSNRFTGLRLPPEREKSGPRLSSYVFSRRRTASIYVDLRGNYGRGQPVEVPPDYESHSYIAVDW